MTEAEAQAWMAQTVIVFTGQDGEQWIGLKEGATSVRAPDDSCSHFLDPSVIQEELTLQQIADLANGG
jgi:hypothetical protein